MNHKERREMSYWLTLAFRLDREPRRAVNGLVLTADRKLHLSILDLVRMNPEERPHEITKYGSTLDHLLSAEGKVSAQAFIVDRLLSTGCTLIPITDPLYPPHLAHRIGPERAPTLLSLSGNPEIWKTAGVAISGSRKSGPAGLSFAREAGRAVAASGNVVVCGLAAGIDREALEGALEAGGRVLGIAPEGLLQSAWLRRPEVRNGRLAIVSEFAPDDRWTAGRAMARNRTIAGFSSALVIADCVASGGTTDQLDVHRAAGLPVYVRTGPGQGALVNELCRRPGVTPWHWSNGAVTWPPREEDVKVVAPLRIEATCNVIFSSDRVQVRLEAPRQLSLEGILDSVRSEYQRAAENTKTIAPILKPQDWRCQDSGSQIPDSRSMDEVPTALAQAGSNGATSKELEALTGLTNYRVRKRLEELLDAKLITKSNHRYYDVKFSVSKSPSARKRSRRKDSAVENEPTLFSNHDLKVGRGRS